MARTETTLSEKQQRDTAREMQGKDWGWRDRAPFADKSEGGGVRDDQRVESPPLRTGRLDAPLSRHELHLPGTLVHTDGKASAETSPSSLGRQLYNEMALPARKTRGPPPRSPLGHVHSCGWLSRGVQNYLFQWKQLTDVSKLICDSCVYACFFPPLQVLKVSMKKNVLIEHENECQRLHTRGAGRSSLSLSLSRFFFLPLSV